ncbi:MAG TPA: hypothetical protein VFH66_08250 [Mycobacteriales bacterium]|nr:hypothetical protein [Mycobacteriales bacterium]
MGNSGSGKTRLARRLAGEFDVPHVELDGFMHYPDWQPSPVDEFRALVADALSAAEREHDGWVVDGNYTHRLGRSVLDRAELVVWLDYPRRVVFWRVLRRTAGRVLLRRTLWNGNRERVASLFSRDPENNILVWSWTNHDVVRRRCEELSSGDPRWLRVRRPGELSLLVDQLRERAGASTR